MSVRSMPERVIVVLCNSKVKESARLASVGLCVSVDAQCYKPGRVGLLI